MTLDDPDLTIRPDGSYLLVFDEVFATDPEDLWEAVTDPARLARWMADYRGSLAVGGTWEVAADDGGVWGTGEVVACDPPRRFETIWHAAEEEPTRLVVSLEPAEGGTRLVLRHDGVQSIYYGAGWQVYLESLAAHVTGTGPGYRDGAAWDARYGELQPAYSERFARLGES